MQKGKGVSVKSTRMQTLRKKTTNIARYKWVRYIMEQGYWNEVDWDWKAARMLQARKRTSNTELKIERKVKKEHTVHVKMCKNAGS